MNKIAELRRIYDGRNRNSETIDISQQDLEKIKNDLYAKGVADGKSSINLEKLHREELLQKELIFNLSSTLDVCLREQEKLVSDLSDLVLSLAISLFRKTFTTCSEKLGWGEISNFIEEKLSLLTAMPSLVITVHPDFQEKIAELCNNYLEDKLVKPEMLVNSNVDFSLTDCVISWESGHLEKKLSNIIADLKRTISENLPEDNDVTEG